MIDEWDVRVSEDKSLNTTNNMGETKATAGVFSARPNFDRACERLGRTVPGPWGFEVSPGAESFPHQLVGLYHTPKRFCNGH